MAHSLLVLVEEAIIPSTVLFLTKVFSTLIFNVVLSLSWTIEERVILGTFPSIGYTNFDHFLAANAYSNLVTFLVIFFVAALVILRGHFFHARHMHPRKLSKLSSSRLSFLVSDSLRVYHQGTIWLLILYGLVLSLVWQAALGVSFLWLSLLSLVFSNLLALVFAVDIVREVESKRVETLEISHSHFQSSSDPVDDK